MRSSVIDRFAKFFH